MLEHPLHPSGYATEKGVEDCIIKTLGRWKSSAHLQYVRLSRNQLVGVTEHLLCMQWYSYLNFGLGFRWGFG